ncbi:MAG: cupin domain-containing protein [Proteiniphilum sp.]|jgi:quercetin dioxygenase-like cupin family protein|nr:cupin domain-containing protein [Proteiniphilum sp.]NCB24949.1 cupin domain-containing protein [Bacteroidia bacterium]HBE12844.1 cupin domain-containing protein [Clostridiales bacterium]MDD2938000.1 cupin domain-containing protein [Proteiniphilum sp.]MDD3075031.1 cupin domain-containing protein [Proteiniphilum sp.]
MATYEKSKVIDLENSIDYASGGVVSKQVTKNKAGNITLFSFDKDQGLTEHSANYDAFVQILDGVAEVQLAGVPHHLKKGDCIIMPAQVPHALKATEPFKMLLTMIRGEE